MALSFLTPPPSPEDAAATEAPNNMTAAEASSRQWMVACIVRLKRGQTSDATVGQVLRYMGWVRRNLAEEGDDVHGLVIARAADERLEYAIREVPKVSLKLYEVSFRLRKAEY